MVSLVVERLGDERVSYTFNDGDQQLLLAIDAGSNERFPQSQLGVNRESAWGLRFFSRLPMYPDKNNISINELIVYIKRGNAFKDITPGTFLDPTDKEIKSIDKLFDYLNLSYELDLNLKMYMPASFNTGSQVLELGKNIYLLYKKKSNDNYYYKLEQYISITQLLGGGMSTTPTKTVEFCSFELLQIDEETVVKLFN